MGIQVVYVLARYDVDFLVPLGIEIAQSRELLLLFGG